MPSTTDPEPKSRPLSHGLLSSCSGPKKALAPIFLMMLGFVLLGSASPLHAQQDTSQTPLYRIETVEGDVLIGTVLSENDEEVIFDARQLGEVTIARANIQSMEEISRDRLRDGEYWFPNPQSTRYLFSPNAIGLPQGEGYYQNTWILLNNVNYGLSDNFSIGAGMIPVFLFGADVLPAWVLPKLSVSVPQANLHFAGGAVLGGVLGGGSVGVLYGASTVGTRSNNATFAVGYGYTGEGLSDAPILNVSGMTRVGQTTYLISENYLIHDTTYSGIVSAGVRWAPENFAVDFALFRPLEDIGDFIAFPWLGVTIPFGR